jgi:hypothetical protein
MPPPDGLLPNGGEPLAECELRCTSAIAAVKGLSCRWPDLHMHTSICALWHANSDGTSKRQEGRVPQRVQLLTHAAGSC